MKVDQVLKLASFKLQNLTLSKDVDGMISLINLGVSDLYRRFNLSIRSETIHTNPTLALYELRNDDVEMLLRVFNKEGYELKQSDVIDSKLWDYKQVNYKSFLLHRPVEGYLYAVYKASPVELVDKLDTIDLPDAMLDALLTFVTYQAYDTINRDNKNATAYWYKQYENKCTDLENIGYRIPLNAESMNIAIKGYV